MFSGISGNNSRRQLYRQELIEKGYSPEAATWLSLGNSYIADPLKAGAQGYLTGAILGGGGKAVNDVSNYVGNKRVMNAWTDLIKSTKANNVITEADAKNAGVVRDDFTATLDENVVNQMDEFAKANGIRIEFADGVRSGTADASINGRTIKIDKATTSPYNFLLGHEMTHFMQGISPEAYAKFERLASKRISGDYIDSVYSRYTNEGVEGFTYQNAIEEAVADYAGGLITDSKSLDAFIADNRNDKGILSTVRYAVTYLKNSFTGNSKVQAEVAEAKLTNAINGVNLENENNIDTVGEMPYTETRYAIGDKKYWVPDLSRPQMERLRQWVRYDAKTSENSITDTANWGFCKIGNTPVFTIYSTENQSEPTILYEVKGAQAEYERYIIEKIVEEIGYGASVNERSNSIDEILSGRWMQQVGSNNNDNGLVGRGSGNRDAAILPKQSRRKPRAAFKNVLGNLFQMEQRGVESDTTSYETEKQGPTLTDDRGGLFVQNGAEQDPDAEKNTAQPDGERYSIKKTAKMGYQEQLELIENRKLNGSNSLYIGTPYADAENPIFSDAPFAMNQSDYRKSRRESGNNKNYSSHGVPIEFFKNMPQYLKDAPMFVDNGNKATVITSYPQNDRNGNPSYEIAGIWKNQPMENDTVNLVKSIYPYDDLAIRIKNAAENGTLVIANKNKAAEMLTTIGVQPAEVSNILNLAKDSISQPDPTVKEQFSIKRDSSVDDSSLSGVVEEKKSGENPFTKALLSFDDSQIAEMLDMEETSEADRITLDKLREEYGIIPKGEKPFRDVELPERTAEDKYVSRTVRTILEAKATPEIALKPIEALVAEGEFSYDRYTDKAAQADAEAIIEDKGWVIALGDWVKSSRNGFISKKNAALGWKLYNNAVNSGDMKTALEIVSIIANNQRDAAQALQATRILKKLSPEAQLYQAQRSVESLQREVNARHRKDGAPELKINEDLARQFMTAETQTQRDEVFIDYVILR